MKDKLVHTGHRDRLRERFRQEGLESFADHEVLELLLFYGRANGDTNPQAHALLESFGSLKAVLEARLEQLEQVKGIGPQAACLISLMVPMFRRYMLSAAAERQEIRGREQAAQYCTALLAGLRQERFYLICLSSRGRVLGRRCIAEGTLQEVHAYPRLVAETALNYNAGSVILCHNHPGGSPEPSQADLETTRRLRRMLESLDIALLDHLVVSGDQAWSMAQHGQLGKG